MSVEVQLKWAEGADRSLGFPRYQTPGAAGADLHAHLNRAAGGDLILAPGARAMVSTGLHMAIPAGFEVQIRPRSGLARSKGITLLNTPGTIDSDYRGLVSVLLINLGEEAATIQHGSRIAQMVVAPVSQARFSEVSTLDETARGDGGFGSTGAQP